MAYPIHKKLVVAVSSSALFDMKSADQIFKNDGERAYRKYQIDNLDNAFNKGVAFPFVKRLLGLNVLYPDEQPVEVIVLSRNDPDSGRRFFRSCNYYGLSITRGAFLTGKPPYPYINAFNASLFLSAHSDDVNEAIAAGFPAGLVMPTTSTDDEEIELRVAFDFDGVIIDDEAETVFHESNDLELFQQSELNKASIPHKPGPLKDLLNKIAVFQIMEMKKVEKDHNYKPALRVAIVTARNAPANERLVTTLKSWGLTTLETFFMGGIKKNAVLEVLRPHIFFDDQRQHLEDAAASVPSVHIPFGIKNRETKYNFS